MRKNAVKAGQEYLHNLAESRRIARTGGDAVLDYLKFYARVEVHEAVAAAHMALAQFLDDIAASGAVRADDIPVLIVWNLNAPLGPRPRMKTARGRICRTPFRPCSSIARSHRWA